MKYDLFFKLAKEAGIEECELHVSHSYTIGFSIFHSEIDNYEINDGYTISAKGIINGKLGSATCDVWNKEKAQYLVNEIVSNAKVIENDDPVFIYKGSPKYKKINIYDKNLSKIPLENKINDAFKLEKLVKEGDKRICEVAQVFYNESETTFSIFNSHGLKLTQKNNSFVIGAYAVAKENDQTKSNGAYFFENDYSKLDIEKLAKEAVDNTVSQLNGKACQTGKYPVLLDREVVSSLLPEFISSADAEEVQKNTSLLKGKLNTKVVSKKLTVEDCPLKKSLFTRCFDSEGVATKNKFIIKNGVLLTYLYTLTTAAKDNVEPTGNALGGSAKPIAAPIFLRVKPGKHSLESLFENMQNGVYITEVNGIHAGLDSQTGNFSLQASGFLIKDGKKDRALDIVTISGNLLKMFLDIKEIGCDSKIFGSAIETPSILIKSLMVGGE